MTTAQGDGGGVTARDAARSWMHSYGIATERYTSGGGDHPMMHSLSAAFKAFATVRPAPAGDAEEVARLQRQAADFAEALTRTNRAMLSIATQRDAAETALAEARAVLRQCEEHFSWCPECEVHLDHGISHAPDCALAAILTTEPGDTA